VEENLLLVAGGDEAVVFFLVEEFNDAFIHVAPSDGSVGIKEMRQSRFRLCREGLTRAVFFQGMLFVCGRRFPDGIEGMSVAGVPRVVNSRTIGEKDVIVNLKNLSKRRSA
jgi:hypothetical protein